MKINLNISSCKFSLTKLKDKFILKTPTDNNLELQTYTDVLNYIKKFYPPFVVKRFKKIETQTI